MPPTGCGKHGHSHKDGCWGLAWDHFPYQLFFPRKLVLYFPLKMSNLFIVTWCICESQRKRCNCIDCSQIWSWTIGHSRVGSTTWRLEWRPHKIIFRFMDWTQFSVTRGFSKTLFWAFVSYFYGFRDLEMVLRGLHTNLKVFSALGSQTPALVKIWHRLMLNQMLLSSL